MEKERSKGEYPRLPWELDRRRAISEKRLHKLLNHFREQINPDTKKRYTARTLAKMFRVSHGTVLYHTNPKYREKIKRRVRKNSKKRYKEVDKEEHKQKVAKSRRYIHRVNGKRLYKYHRERTKNGDT